MLLNKIGVLVVDDVQILRTLLVTSLTQMGFKDPVVVSNVEEAQVALTKKPIHLILCDWHLGSLSGIDLRKYIRSEASLKNILFVMVTAEVTTEKVMEAAAAGVNDYIVKPFDQKGLESKIIALLKKKKVLG